MSISVFYEHLAEAAIQENIPLEKVVRIVREKGISGVYLDRNRLREEPQIEKLLSDAEMAVHGLYQFFDFGYGNHSEEIREGKNLLEDARRLGAAALIIPGFIKPEHLSERALQNRKIIPDEEKDNPVIQRMVEALRELVAFGNKIGVEVGMEDFDDCFSPVACVEGLLFFVEQVPGLSVTFDTGNFLYSEQDVLQAQKLLLPYVRQVHLKDRSLTFRQGECKETVLGRKMYQTAVGDGDIPMGKIMDVFQKNGYKGDYAIEHFGSPCQLEDIIKSVEYIESVLV